MQKKTGQDALVRSDKKVALLSIANKAILYKQASSNVPDVN